MIGRRSCAFIVSNDIVSVANSVAYGRDVEGTLIIWIGVPDVHLRINKLLHPLFHAYTIYFKPVFVEYIIYTLWNNLFPFLFYF